MKDDHWANVFVGIPFKLNGRSAESGLDCYGLVKHVYKQAFYIELPDHSVLDNSLPEVSMAMARGARAWKTIDRKELRAGDILQFTIGSCPFHVGIYIGGGLMLHSMGSPGSVIEKLRSQKWKKRLSGCYRYESAGSAGPASVGAEP